MSLYEFNKNLKNNVDYKKRNFIGLCAKIKSWLKIYIEKLKKSYNSQNKFEGKKRRRWKLEEHHAWPKYIL